MLLALSLAISLGHAEPTFDFDHPPAPAPVIVEAIGKKLGRNLVADEDLAVDILIVHLDDADPNQALEWIAEAIEGEWKQDDDTLRLTRSHEIELRQQAESRTAKLRQIKSWLDRTPLADPLDRPTAGLVAELLHTAMSQRTPGNLLPPDLLARMPSIRFAQRVSQVVDYSQFLELPIGAEVLIPFSESVVDPRLPKEVGRLLSDFKREDALFAAAAKQRGIEYPEYLSYGSLQPGLWDRGPVRCAVQVTNDASLNVRVLAAWGDSHVVDYTPFAPNGLRRDPPVLHKEWEFSPKLPELPTDFWRLKAPRNFVPKQSATQVPEIVSKYFLVDPKMDLFGLGTSDLVEECARTLGKSVVALLPDSSAYAPNRLVARPGMTLQELSYYLFLPDYVEIIERPDVIIARPAAPSVTRAERVPRRSLRTIVSEAQRGSTSIDVYADLVAKSDGTNYVADPRQLLSRVTRMYQLEGGSTSALLAIRAYGLLTPEQRRQARRDESVVPWNTLDRGEQSIWSAVLRSEARVGYPGSLATELGSDGKPSENPVMATRAALSSGALPAALVVRVRTGVALAGSDSAESPSAWYQFIEGPSFDSMVAHKELGLEGWPHNRFVLAPFERIEVWIQLNDKRIHISTCTDSFVPETQMTFEYHEIPKEMLDARRSEIDRIKAILRDIPPGR